jgi:hypothetical protein
MLIAAPSIAQQTETVTYTYDALGRLIVSSISGGPNNGTQTGTTFDPASNRTNYTVTGTPTPPSFAIGNAAAVTEGGQLTFTVTKTGGTAASYSVNYATADGTATSGSDYTAASGTLTFAAGETTKTIQVSTIDDSIIESAETVLVNLSSPTNGATITTVQGSGTINDNDASFAISNAAAVTEGGTLSYTVTKTGGTSSSYSVNYATANGTATSGSDYTAASGTLTFAAGETTKTIQVATIDDSVVESAETVLVNLSSPTNGATITTAQGSGTINDNDASFAIGNATAVTEGGTLSYTVTKTGGTSGSFSINYATANGTATSGSDYTAASGTLTFAAGETTKTIPVTTIDDSVVESAETVLVNLTSPTNGATITTAQGSGTINDNDASFAISNAAAVTEGGTLSYTVTKTGGTSGSFSVNYATANGTATSGSDFTATSGTLTFAAGETTKTITVATIDDSAVESAETVLVNLSSPTGGATITTGQGSGTINDNDVAFAIGNATGAFEGGALTFTVTKAGTTSSSYSVNYATANGTATSGSDFTATSGTLTFLPGDTTKTITVATIDDSVVEPAETMLVNLSSPTGNATITTAQGSGTILDNDVAFAISNAAAVTEGGTLTFTVTRAGATSSGYSVNYATASGTATSGSDFTATSGTLTFLATDTTKTITVATIDDSVVESPETVLVNLSSPTDGATITTSQGSGTINDNDTAPVANADTTSFNCSVYQTVDLVANDTDPGNHVPLHLVSINGPGSATVTSSTSVTIGETSPGTYTFSYVVANSAGTTSTGQLTATVTGLSSECVQF